MKICQHFETRECSRINRQEAVVVEVLAIERSERAPTEQALSSEEVKRPQANEIIESPGRNECEAVII